MKRANRELEAWRWRRSIPWGLGVTLFALAPKCFLCVVAYLGIGAALGLKSYELCGGPPKGFAGWEALPFGAGVLAATALIAVLRAWRPGSFKASMARMDSK